MGIFSRLLDHLAAKVKVETSVLESVRRALDASATPSRNVIYTLRRVSHLERALLERVCRRLEQGASGQRLLPAPQEVIYLRNRSGHELTVGQTARFRRFVRGMLREQLARSPQPVYVPAAFFAGLGPRPLPRPTRLPIDFRFAPLGDLWLLFVYWSHRDALRLELSEPVAGTASQSAGELYRRLSLALYRHEKLARGPAPKSTQTVEQIVLSGDRFERLLQELAVDAAASREQMYESARRRFHEIAATMNGAAIRILYHVLHPVVRAVFEKVEVGDLEPLRKAVAQHPVVVLPSHKSHFDYILISWLLYHEKLPLPYVAAGANLNFFPVGGLMKAAGGFFIRRTIGNDRLYKLVLDNYLQYLIKRGHLVAFYIEGGRSRSGAVRAPRLGLLKYLVAGWAAGGRDDVMLAPLGISYERIAEEEALVREELGEGKQAENLRAFWRLKGIRRRRFGSVMVQVGTPISLKAFRAEHEEEGGGHAADDPVLIEDLAFAIARRIMDCTALTGTSLAATVLHTYPRFEGAVEDVARRMRTLMTLRAVALGFRDAAAWDAATTLGDAAGQQILDALQVGGTLRKAFHQAPLEVALRLVVERFSAVGYADSVDGEGRSHVYVTPEQRLRT
ncbi:MAG: glycerol-3-phosphate acyltransferase, partial [Bdellovibrionales bacterium]|nr:glycerol-3-phosphate acyltransferase [Bdellovibrionales bacterium]